MWLHSLDEGLFSVCIWFLFALFSSIFALFFFFFHCLHAGYFDCGCIHWSATQVREKVSPHPTSQGHRRKSKVFTQKTPLFNLLQTCHFMTAQVGAFHPLWKKGWNFGKFEKLSRWCRTAGSLGSGQCSQSLAQKMPIFNQLDLNHLIIAIFLHFSAILTNGLKFCWCRAGGPWGRASAASRWPWVAPASIAASSTA